MGGYGVQKADLPKRTITDGIINIPHSKTIKIPIANIGPNALNEPYDAKVNADIATIVVPAEPVIDGATFDIALVIACHLSGSP